MHDLIAEQRVALHLVVVIADRPPKYSDDRELPLPLKPARLFCA